MSRCECGADHASYKTYELYGTYLCQECYEKWLEEEIFGDYDDLSKTD